MSLLGFIPLQNYLHLYLTIDSLRSERDLFNIDKPLTLRLYKMDTVEDFTCCAWCHSV